MSPVCASLSAVRSASGSAHLEPEDLRNGAYEEVVEFVRALKTGDRPWPTVEDILPSARICFAIAESVDQSGQRKCE